ncbi:MAG: helix-turn-helix domain-containing protein [Deltaproteobacteria bacterium]|nr:helix-turn-helix domain-containing protein [Deltaproteobacteria bacterium]
MISTLLLRMEPELSPDVADELTREVFLRLLETARKRGKRGPIHDQLRGLAVVETRNWRMRQWLPGVVEATLTPRTPTEQDDEDVRPPPPPDSSTRLAVVFEGLSRSRREILILHVVEGMSVNAMARALGRSKGSVRRVLRGSRDALWSTRSTKQIPAPSSKECKSWPVFIDGDLKGGDVAAFQSHSSDCDHCGPATLEWWRLHRELKSAAEDRAARQPSASQSREVAALLVGRAFERKRARLRMRVLLAVSGAALAGGAAWALGWLG